MELSEHIEENVELFEQKLKAQAELYRTLLGLARRQAQEISTDNVDAFVLLLEEKKKIVEEIGKIEIMADPLRKFWEAHREEVGEPTRVKLRSAVNEIRTLLEELLEIESRSQQELGLTKDTVEEEIRRLNVGTEAIRSYMPHHDSKPRFMDEAG